MRLTDAQLGALRLIRVGRITNWTPARINVRTLAALERRRLIIGEATGHTLVRLRAGWPRIASRPAPVSENETAYRLTDVGRDALTEAGS